MTGTRNRRNGPRATAENAPSTRSLRLTRSTATTTTTTTTTSNNNGQESSAPSRRRGTRHGMQNNNNNSTSATNNSRNRVRKMDKSVTSPSAVVPDSDSEVEMPRREIFESVLIINKNDNQNSNNRFINKSRFATPAKGHEEVMGVPDLQDPLENLNSTSTTTRAGVAAVFDLSTSSLEPQGHDQEQDQDDFLALSSPFRIAREEAVQDMGQEQERQEEEDDDDVDDMISRLSLSPPPLPTMFELLGDDYIGGGRKSESGFTPWLMHFDSDLSAETSPVVNLRSVPDLKVSDLDMSHLQSSTVASSPTTTTTTLRQRASSLADTHLFNMMQPLEDSSELDMDLEQGKEDDDPFGFFKVERQLSRMRSSRPRLLPINERVSRGEDVRSSSPLRNLRASNSDISCSSSGSGNEGLGKVAIERAAARRRGGTGQSNIDKGKTAVRGRGLGSDEQVDTMTINDTLSLVTEPTAAEATEAADIEKAVRLSLNDLAGLEKTGESSSSSSVSVSMSSRPRPRPTNIDAGGSMFSVEDISLPEGKEVVIGALRTSRRVSWLYGRSYSAAERVAEEIPSVRTATTTTTTTLQDDILEQDDLFCSPPSTPPRKPMSHRSTSKHFRYSIGPDSMSPIVLETTPTKKPEAGMPSTYGSPDSGRTDQRKTKPNKFMRTELLEAMLPRPRKARTTTIANWGVHSKKGGDNVFEIESDTDVDESGPDEESEEDEEEEEEVLVRRRHNRPATVSTGTSKGVKATSTTATAGKKSAVASTKATKATTARPNQKRQAPASTITAPPASKRQRPQKPSVPIVSSGAKSKKAVSVAVEKEDDKSHWTKQQRIAHEERMRYFAQVDDFELEVETIR
ncbi:hypothetical protein BGZ96_008766 [Linnemannia gamsii]|uniref:Uncharacterized protein n=1 Tax=Linnemannia gamsii TaxID=64522 RepID=A0ABQ7JXP0_9FUNG|nr:hypothetical protein BGZ96_008766 [Linnemannia gamsii]